MAHVVGVHGWALDGGNERAVQINFGGTVNDASAPNVSKSASTEYVPCSNGIGREACWVELVGMVIDGLS